MSLSATQTNDCEGGLCDAATITMRTFVDLFAGCGGLSLGLHRAGFRHVLAVEKSPMAGETYYHNFIRRLPPGAAGAAEWREFLELATPEQAKRGLVVDEVAAVLADAEVIRRLRQMGLDLVAGGPPCQGFSMAGRRDPRDQRNQLAWQFLEFVAATNPKSVVIENVPGIGQDFVKHGSPAPLADLSQALAQAGEGYVVQPMRLNAMHYGVPQHRPRIVIVAVRADLAQGSLAGPVLPLWSSGEMPTSPLCPSTGGAPIRTVRDALWDLVDAPDGGLRYAGPPDHPAYRSGAGAYAFMMRTGRDWFPPTIVEASPPCQPLNGSHRRHSDAVRRRFELYQYLDRAGVKPSILNALARPGLRPGDTEEMAWATASALSLPARAPAGSVLAASPGELAALLLASRTKKHSQRPLRWDEPSPTVMSLPDDFVHPEYPRTLTVREMARIQSFPDLFEFRSKETTGSFRRREEVPQYTQVGNAVPPILAEAIGRTLKDFIDGHE